MAEMVFSAVVEETLKQAFSGLIGRSSGRGEDEKEQQHVERLEMALIRLEAALEASRRWRIRDAPLLRWRRKLKRAAEECGGELRERRRRTAAEEKEEEDDGLLAPSSSFSFPRRLARAAVAALFGGHGGSRDADADAAVRRFEWYADGAGEFLRFVELGGGRHAPRVDPLIGRLLAGDELRYCRFVRRGGGGEYRQLYVRPVRLDGRGVEAKLIFVCEDDEAPERNLCLGAILRLSESTDLVGTLVRCLDLLLVTPHFRPAAESARRKLVALPRQDFSWVPSSTYLDTSGGNNEHWNAMHSCLSRWFRPNPLCCSNQKHVSEELEPVIGVFLQRHIPLAEYNAHRSKSTTAIIDGDVGATCLEKKKNVPQLRLGLHFSPHGSSDMAPAADSAAVEVVDGEELAAGGVHRNISSLEELDEFALPKAIDCLRHRRPEAAAYQLFWKARHGTAYLEVEKTGLLMEAPPRRVGVSRRPVAIRRRRDPKLGMWTQVVVDFFNLWVARAPRRLQGSIIEWVQKANEIQNKGAWLSKKRKYI